MYTVLMYKMLNAYIFYKVIKIKINVVDYKNPLMK